jgi:uncharacterized protein (TIGR03437 family)
MIPWAQGAAAALVKVSADGIEDSIGLTVPSLPHAPQLLRNNEAAAAIDTTAYTAAPVSASNPAHAGDSVQLYGNGLGRSTINLSAAPCGSRSVAHYQECVHGHGGRRQRAAIL